SIGGVGIETVVAQHGTPVFIYDRSVLDRKLSALRNALPSKFAISYSVKANPNRTILRHFVDRGCGLEIASAGEFHLSRSIGCPPSNIVFAGPGKTEAELERVLSDHIGQVHVESLTEIDRVAAISRRLGVKAKVAVRINPCAEAQGGAMRMGGRAAPFGIDEENLDSVLDRILAEPSVEFEGIHLFTGTQILDYAILARQYRKAIEIAGRAAKKTRRPIHTVDFGGGLGIPYFPGEKELDTAALQKELMALMIEIENDSSFRGTRFMVEPGRYLVGDGGVYVTRISDIKVSRGKKFLIVDGGMNHHLAASGNLGQVIKRNFPVALLTKFRERSAETVDIVGPLCTPLDVLAREAQVPTAAIGDLVGIFQSGAYARTASPLGFLSHPSPPEVWIDAGRVELIRPRGRYSDCL
ncbi:MAG TPA: type III PLP-dependent enzyme, partial [Candidatus Binatia bacterium]